MRTLALRAHTRGPWFQPKSLGVECRIYGASGRVGV